MIIWLSKEVKLAFDSWHADVVNNRPAPHTGAILRIWLDTKLIDCVWLQFVNDCIACWTGLVVPLPVLLTVTHCVVSENKTQNKQNNSHTMHPLMITSGGMMQEVQGEYDATVVIFFHFLFSETLRANDAIN